MLGDLPVGKLLNKRRKSQRLQTLARENPKTFERVWWKRVQGKIKTLKSADIFNSKCSFFDLEKEMIKELKEYGYNGSSTLVVCTKKLIRHECCKEIARRVDKRIYL